MIKERFFCFLALASAICTPVFLRSANASTVQFDPPTYTVAENAGSLIVRVTRTGDLSNAATINYATANGRAVGGQDFDAKSGTLTFGPNVSEQTFTLNIINDAQAEGPEEFTINLLSPAGTALGSSKTATVTIADDDSATGTIQFDRASYAVGESDGSAILVVNRSGGLAAPATVTFSTFDGTATAGSDYDATSGTITFAPGVVRQTIPIRVTDDNIPENSETFSVLLGVTSTNATLGNPTTAVVTIFDNDGVGSTVQFNPTSYSAKETPGKSTVNLTVTATRFGDPNTPITVNYTTSDGTAMAGSDYERSSGTVTFGPGETQATISITILDDSLVENAENFFVALSDAVGATIGNNSTATVTIADDDSPNATIGFSASSYDVNEGAGAVTLTVTRSGGLAFAATVNYATHDDDPPRSDSARAGTNYVATSGTLTFAPGQTSKTIQVPIIDEGTADPTLRFTVTLTDANGTGFVGGQNTATVNTLDNDANTFRFSPDKYTVTEGAGSVTLTVEVVRSGDPAQEISVDFVTVDGSAKAGAKYTRTEGRLTFAANVTSQTITVPIIDEPFIEGTTTFNVVLSNPLPAKSEGGNAASRLGSPSSATVTIIDNDARTFQFSSSNTTVANSSGSVNVTVTFSRATDPSGTYTVDFATADGSAMAGRDYTATSGRLTFGPGETSKSINIQITPQPAGQPTRQFRVVLSNPSAGTALGQNSTTTVTITNPDFSTKLFNISTRGPVQTGNDVMIAGFIIQGDSEKRLVFRGIGPSLTQFGVPNAISDPVLTLVDSNGTQRASNDDYTSNSAQDRQTLADNGLTPNDSRESAIVAALGPGAYTAILRGKANGVGLVEVYDISNDLSTKLVNISTRGKVEMGDNGAMIAGFIVATPQNQPGTAQRLAIRAIGPSLKNFGISDALADTTLDIYRGSQLILSNDNWKTNSAQDQQTLQANGLAPSSDKEAAIVTILDPGSYSAVVRGKNNTTGVALVEVYNLN